MLIDSSSTLTSASTNDGDPHLLRGPRGYPLLPGGFGRSTLYSGAAPFYALKGEGCHLRDDRGRDLIDANNNFTTLIHGNAHPEILAAAEKAMYDGTSFGVPNLREWEHAEVLLSRLPELDQVRYTNSGTEAVMTAVRVARAATGRDRCIVARGGYHGTSEVALCAGGEKYTRGIPRGVINDVTVLDLNDVDALRATVAAAPDQYAVIIIDLLPNRAGLIPVKREFVTIARELADEYGIALLIDEVIGLRLGYGGFIGGYGVTPDLMTVGKIVGGGFPVGAVIGREKFMRVLDPTQPDCLPHGGTFSANPVTMAAGAASLRMLTASEIARLNQYGDDIRRTATAAVADLGWEVRGVGSLLRPFPVGSATVDEKVGRKIWWAAYDGGLLLSPANLGSLSTPMTSEVVAEISEILAAAIREIVETGE
ncbi:aspartate aminotransferase family protein [Mycolicibacterium setense]